MSKLFRFSDTGVDKELRESAHHGADIVLLCFQVTELKEEAQVLVNELRVFTKDIAKDKLVLVGTKSDLKDDEMRSRGRNIAKEIGSEHYLEYSSAPNQNRMMSSFVKKIIDISIRQRKPLLADIEKRRYAPLCFFCCLKLQMLTLLCAGNH